MCSHIFRTSVYYFIPALSWNECNIILLVIHWLLFTDYLKLYTYCHLQFWHSRRSRIHKQLPKVFLKILQVFFRISQISQESTCVGVFFYKVASLQACNVTKKTPAQVFSCEIWEILRNNYFEEHLNDCFCVLITSSCIDFYTLFIFTNKFFFITQLKE